MHNMNATTTMIESEIASLVEFITEGATEHFWSMTRTSCPECTSEMIPGSQDRLVREAMRNAVRTYLQINHPEFNNTGGKHE